jgi:NIMA (never in mitosis gene a)-related kinase
VYKVKRKVDGKLYALKMVILKDLSDKERENAINEVRILASINHPNIISYKESFVDKASESLCIVMELVDDGDLYGQITKSLKK